MSAGFKAWSLRSLLGLRCPACGGDTFKAGWFRTARSCAACGQVFEREAGFYAGAIYPFYGGAALVGGLGILLGFADGLSLDACLLVAGALVALASPWLFWYSRLSFVHTCHRFFGEES